MLTESNALLVVANISTFCQSFSAAAVQRLPSLGSHGRSFPAATTLAGRLRYDNSLQNLVKLEKIGSLFVPPVLRE